MDITNTEDPQANYRTELQIKISVVQNTVNKGVLMVFEFDMFSPMLYQTGRPDSGCIGRTL